MSTGLHTISTHSYVHIHANANGFAVNANQDTHVYFLSNLWLWYARFLWCHENVTWIIFNRFYPSKSFTTWYKEVENKAHRLPLSLTLTPRRWGPAFFQLIVSSWTFHVLRVLGTSARVIQYCCTYSCDSNIYSFMTPSWSSTSTQRSIRLYWEEDLEYFHVLYDCCRRAVEMQI
jgi:hypothetical protein